MKNIYCIGRNYSEHVRELDNDIPDEPIVFQKSTSSLRKPNDKKIAFPNETFHHECEVVVCIGRDIDFNDNVSIKDISFVTLGIDLTRRGVQNFLKQNGHPWTVSKSFFGSAIIGDFINAEKFDINNLDFYLKVNEEMRQMGNTNLMLFSIDYLLNYINSILPLNRYDLIFTGTPKGVGEIKSGDKFEFGFNRTPYCFKGEL